MSVQYTGVCSTREDYEYSGGYHEPGSWVHWGISLSKPGDIQDIGGISLSTPGRAQYTGEGVSWAYRVFSTLRNTMSTVGTPWWLWGISWIQRGCSVHWGIRLVHWDDTMMSVGGISWVHWEMFSTLGFPYKFNCFPNDLPPHLSWYPRCTHDIPPVYSWSRLMISPTVLIISSRCTEHPPLYCTPPVYCTDIMQSVYMWTRIFFSFKCKLSLNKICSWNDGHHFQTSP